MVCRVPFLAGYDRVRRRRYLFLLIRSTRQRTRGPFLEPWSNRDAHAGVIREWRQGMLCRQYQRSYHLPTPK